MEKKKRLLIALDENDYRKLTELTEASGLTMTKVVRLLLRKQELPKKLNANEQEIIDQLRYIGNNLNQLVAKVNTLGWANKAEVLEQIGKLQEQMNDIKQVLRGQNF